MHRNRLRFALLTLVLPCISASLHAQGADLCANAQVISGTGSFAFDNTTAATDGLPDPACNFSGQSDITNDVWYSWTAATSGTFTFSTCGGVSIDSKIAVYAGSCAGAVVACNDDNCALQSSVDVAVTAGSTYIIRIGDYPSAVSGIGTFSINPQGQLAVLDTQVSPVNGHTYMLLVGGSWTNAESTAVALGGHLATVRSQTEHDWINATWHNFQGIDVDLWIGLTDQATEGTFAWISGEPVTYTNWDTGEPNDGGGTGEDYADMRKNNPAAFWNDLPDDPPITGAHYHPHGVVEINTTPGTAFCFGDGTGTACPCANNSAVGNGQGCLSSLGIGASLAASGLPSVSGDSIVLAGSNMPNSSCLYFQGTTQLAAGGGAAFGDGLRCAGGTVIRLGTKANVAGASQYPTGADPHVSVKGAIPAAGATRTYQVWYRNASAFCTPSTFNLSNGLSLAWMP